MTLMLNQALIEQIIPGTISILHREYPNGILHFLQDEKDVRGPRSLHPAFYGCFDWHSAVHAHWQLVRAIRCYPNASFVDEAIVALDRSLTDGNMAGEMAYLVERPSFEMPYGMAWLLQLAAELHEYERDEGNANARHWRQALAPLEAHAAECFQTYLSRLPFPIRGGLHNQTAFSMGLALDWARTVGNTELASLIEERAIAYFGADVGAPLAYEPSGVNFLSPSLAEADLMQRVLSTEAFVGWLDGFLGTDAGPVVERLSPVEVIDFASGQLAHFAGLNMSRAWMLDGISAALPAADPRAAAFTELAKTHRERGLPAALNGDYMVTHWVPTFVIYLITGRGLDGGDQKR